MCKGLESRTLQRRYRSGLWANGKILNMINHKWNVNKTRGGVICPLEWLLWRGQKIGIGKDAERWKALCMLLRCYMVQQLWKTDFCDNHYNIKLLEISKKKKIKNAFIVRPSHPTSEDSVKWIQSRISKRGLPRHDHSLVPSRWKADAS